MKEKIKKSVSDKLEIYRDLSTYESVFCTKKIILKISSESGMTKESLSILDKLYEISKYIQITKLNATPTFQSENHHSLNSISKAYE